MTTHTMTSKQSELMTTSIVKNVKTNEDITVQHTNSETYGTIENKICFRGKKSSGTVKVEDGWCDTATIFLKTRPEGVGRRQWKNSLNGKGSFGYNCVCDCGRRSGAKKNKQTAELWLKLHKKNCEYFKK